MADTDTGSTGTDGAADGDKASADEVEKWRTMARKHEARAKENADAAKRLADIEASNQTDLERLNERANAAEKRAESAELKALRYEVAADKGVPSKLMKFLHGNDEEELRSSADELLEAVTPATGDGNDDASDKGDKDGDTPPSGRPTERMRSGASNDAEPETTDPTALAASIPRM